MHSTGQYYAPGRPSTVFYDLVEEIYRPIAPELAFYLAYAKKINTPVLELGCGTGRISWALAKAGHEVMAMDNSLAMLERAVNKKPHYPAAAASRLQLMHADICDMDLWEKFKLIIAPYRVFNHLTTSAAQQAFLDTARRHLARGGRLIFDTTQPSKTYLIADTSRQVPLVQPLPHLNVVMKRSMQQIIPDMKQQTFATDFVYTIETADGGAFNHVDRLQQRWATDAQIKAMLKKAGFKLDKLYQDFKKTKPKSPGDRVWVVG